MGKNPKKDRNLIKISRAVEVKLIEKIKELEARIKAMEVK